ncbi:DUF2199 domain-containing protein [Niveibacterium microcysteis]|uniref:DUF2199 domain-containing protein n=1 Tax=Niveibacterium microcysteis TaxID=2811415 RepID=A0ABX7M8Y3_9RHOO|nr:DUF2199 domain-containing protein [Niveibacterium microcysteis]QSI78204.1 DUF2199 domain-containing protein [Niveibacterium microcysteis]
MPFHSLGLKVTSPQSFLCSVCGKSHEGAPTDTAFALPDDVWALPEEQRSARAKWTSDLCQFGERYFIRCLLPVPFSDTSGYYGWGAWAEVEWPVFERYLAIYEVDATDEPEAKGLLANNIKEYGATLGLPVRIRFGISSQRPKLAFAQSESHALAREIQAGMPASRYHQILVSRGNA